MEHIKTLCALDGVSGSEAAVRAYIEAQLKKSPARIDMHTDALGNLFAGVQGAQRAARKLVLAAHMDEVGLIVTHEKDGFTRFETVGGVDGGVLYGRRVRCGEHVGVVGGKAVHLCGKEEKNSVPDELWLDMPGARPGDTCAFDSEYIEMGEHTICAKALDDRIGCALLLSLAEETPLYDITLVFTVQEEIGTRGAQTAAFAVAPDIAVVVEATTAAEHVCVPGEGAVISFMDKGTLYDAELYARLRALPCKTQTKTAVAGGNDAAAWQRAGAGCRVAAVSVPCRNLHSPSVTADTRDIEAVRQVLQAVAEEWPC